MFNIYVEFYWFEKNKRDLLIERFIRLKLIINDVIYFYKICNMRFYMRGIVKKKLFKLIMFY